MARTADKTDIPKRLAKAGYELFNQHGYNATGIQQITDAAGVPKGSFYNHFDSKEGFAAVIIGNYIQWMGEQWALCLADAPSDPLEALRHVFQRFTAYHEQSATPGCLIGNFAAEVSESSPKCREVLQTGMNHWRDHLATLLANAQQAGKVRTDMDATTLAVLFWDMWEGALLRMKVEQDSRALKEAVSAMLDHFLQP